MKTWLVVVTLLTLGHVAHAQVAGKVEKTEGAAEVLRLGTSQWVPIGVDDPVSIGDQLRTREGTKMSIRLQDDSVLSMGEKTVMTIDEHTIRPSGQNTSIFSLLLGKVRAVVSDRYTEPGSRFEMRTATAVAGVRGTEFVAETTADQSKFFGVRSETVVQTKAFGVCQRFKGCSS